MMRRTGKFVLTAVILSGCLLVLLSPSAPAEHQTGDMMCPGKFQAVGGAACLASEQRAYCNLTNAGVPLHEFTNSQGGDLPDPLILSGVTGSNSNQLESPLHAVKSYIQNPVGSMRPGSNHDVAQGIADGLETVSTPTTTYTGGGGGDFIPMGFARGGAVASGNVYGGYGGFNYANYSTRYVPMAARLASVKTAGGAVKQVAASADQVVGDVKGAIGSAKAIANSAKSMAKAAKSMVTTVAGLTALGQNIYQIVTAPETEPLLGPSQVYSGLSAPMAANMRDLLQEAGLEGPQGGKMLGAAEAGVVGMAGAFQAAKAENAPGANTEQAKVNQNAEKGQTADNLAGMEREQAATAIDFVRTYLEHFTANGGNNWNKLRDNLFVPMALLLILPGAVLAQVKSIASQGFSVLGEISPWDGIVRSIIGIFLIPTTYLIMNYGIDLANLLNKTVSDQYKAAFGRDMFEDAFSGHVRAFPVRLPEENDQVISAGQCVMGNRFGNTPLAKLEGKLLAVKYEDPAAGYTDAPADRTNERVPFMVNEARLMYNRINAGLAFAWTILCAIQQCYLYYLWFVGPVVAALWVYPMGQLRQAFSNWIEGVVSLCFWSFFWSTTVLLTACFRGVDDTGTIMFTALNTLALTAVKFAFDFSGFVKDAGREAAAMGAKAASLASAKPKEQNPAAPPAEPAPAGTPSTDPAAPAAEPVEGERPPADPSTSDRAPSTTPAASTKGPDTVDNFDDSNPDPVTPADAPVPPPPVASVPVEPSLPPSSESDRYPSCFPDYVPAEPVAATAAQGAEVGVNGATDNTCQFEADQARLQGLQFVADGGQYGSAAGAALPLDAPLASSSETRTADGPVPTVAEQGVAAGIYAFADQGLLPASQFAVALGDNQVVSTNGLDLIPGQLTPSSHGFISESVLASGSQYPIQVGSGEVGPVQTVSLNPDRAAQFAFGATGEIAGVQPIPAQGYEGVSKTLASQQDTASTDRNAGQAYSRGAGNDMLATLFPDMGSMALAQPGADQGLPSNATVNPVGSARESALNIPSSDSSVTNNNIVGSGFGSVDDKFGPPLTESYSIPAIGPVADTSIVAARFEPTANVPKSVSEGSPVPFGMNNVAIDNPVSAYTASAAAGAVIVSADTTNESVAKIRSVAEDPVTVYTANNPEAVAQNAGITTGTVDMARTATDIQGAVNTRNATVGNMATAAGYVSPQAVDSVADKVVTADGSSTGPLATRTLNDVLPSSASSAGGNFFSMNPPSSYLDLG